MYFSIQQPTKSERREMLLDLLKEENRVDDYPFLVESLSPPEEITNIASPGSGKNMTIGIIGGGMAGLAAAFELRKLGFHITIFDAQKHRIGGRVYTHYFDANGQYYGELGAMRIPISHESVWHYIDLFGLKVRPFIQTTPADTFYIRHHYACNDVSGQSVMRNIYPSFDLTPQERRTPWRELLNNPIKSLLESMPPKVRQEIIRIKKEYHPKIVEIDNLKIRDVFKLAGLSQGAIHMLGNLSPPIDDFSYRSAIELLSDAYSLDSVTLYRIHGGTAKLPLAFYHSFYHPNTKKYYPKLYGEHLGVVSYKGGHRVEKVQQVYPRGPVVIHYRNGRGSYLQTQTFDYVICAIPFSTLRHVDLCPLFSSKKMQAIQKFTYENAFKTVQFFSKRFWEEPNIICGIKLGGSSVTDRPVTSIWYPSDHSEYLNLPFPPPDEPGVLLSTYNFALDAVRLGNLPSRRKYHEITSQIEEIHRLPKGYLDPILLDQRSVNWNDEEWSLGAFGYYSPSQKSVFSWIMAQPEYDNRIFFSGEHVSGKHGWIQGALKTGMEAANSIARVIRESDVR